MTNETSPFAELMKSLSGSLVFFDTLKGNNGDRLIELGMRELLARYSIRCTRSPDQADLILLNGGGAMNDLWPEGAATVMNDYLTGFPGKMVVVGPSSFHFTRLDFRGILDQANAPVVLFCRETRSFDFLKSLQLPSHVETILSRDLALELEGSEFLDEQRRRSENAHVLCAMRKDLEGEAGILAKTRAPWLPAPVRKPLSRLRDRLVATRSSKRINPILGAIRPQPKAGEITYRDVSVSVDFDTFCGTIAAARAIITNRLHIAIFGTLLDKEVHLVPGNYHKIEGVYDYSLRHYPKVSLH